MAALPEKRHLSLTVCAEFIDLSYKGKNNLPTHKITHANHWTVQSSQPGTDISNIVYTRFKRESSANSSVYGVKSSYLI